MKISTWLMLISGLIFGLVLGITGHYIHDSAYWIIMLPTEILFCSAILVAQAGH